ncbi:MAG: MauE/DoxX family redox-associated membrane protein [Porticoccaceae bacterium]
MLEPIALLFANAATLFIAWLLVDSGWHKRDRANRDYYHGVFAGYGLLLAERWRGLISLWGWAEVALALTLLIDPLRWIAAPAALVLLSVYFAAIASQLVRGQYGRDCGCAGPDGVLKISPALLVRNGLLVGLGALALTAQLGASSLLWWQIIPTAAILWMSYLSFEQLLTNRQKILSL